MCTTYYYYMALTVITIMNFKSDGCTCDSKHEMCEHFNTESRMLKVLNPSSLWDDVKIKIRKKTFELNGFILNNKKMLEWNKSFYSFWIIFFHS